MQNDLGGAVGGFLRRPYWNVILFSVLTALGFNWLIAGALTEIPVELGFGEVEIFLAHGVLFSLAVVLFGNLAGTAVVFARRAAKSGGSLISINALALVVAAYYVLRSAVTSGMIFYFGPTPAALVDVISLTTAIQAAMTFTGIIGGGLGLLSALISTFASRDAQIEEEEDADLAPDERPPTAEASAAA